MMWEDGSMENGGAADYLDVCLCKGQLYYVQMERVQSLKQPCQPERASVCEGAKKTQVTLVKKEQKRLYWEVDPFLKKMYC